MFENRSETAEIKLIDFGLSRKFLPGQLETMTETVGTMYTMSPQVLQGVYTSQADLWSIGVITYMLLCSHRPFYNRKRSVMIDRIMRATYNFNADYWNHISDDAKHFVSRLLVLDPKLRFDAEKAQGHRWLSKKQNIPESTPDSSVSDAVGDSLLLYKNSGQLKRLALNVSSYMSYSEAVRVSFQEWLRLNCHEPATTCQTLQVVANLSSPDEIRELRKCFDTYDTSNDGIISYEEFKLGLQEAKNINTSLKTVFDSVVSGKTGDFLLRINKQSAVPFGGG